MRRYLMFIVLFGVILSINLLYWKKIEGNEKRNRLEQARKLLGNADGVSIIERMENYEKVLRLMIEEIEQVNQEKRALEDDLRQVKLEKQALEGKVAGLEQNILPALPMLPRKWRTQSGQNVSIPAASSGEISKLYKAPLSPDGFFQEAHVKLRPVDFSAEGIFLCGTAHYPKHISEAISQAYGAAGRAATLLAQDTVTASGSVCEVNETKCIGCEECILACTYGAIAFYDTRRGKKARVTPVLCKGDGLCVAKCPTGAISLKHYTDEEIIRQIDAAVSEL